MIRAQVSGFNRIKELCIRVELRDHPECVLIRRPGKVLAHSRRLESHQHTNHGSVSLATSWPEDERMNLI